MILLTYNVMRRLFSSFLSMFYHVFFFAMRVEAVGQGKLDKLETSSLRAKKKRKEKNRREKKKYKEKR